MRTLDPGVTAEVSSAEVCAEGSDETSEERKASRAIFAAVSAASIVAGSTSAEGSSQRIWVLVVTALRRTKIFTQLKPCGSVWIKRS